MIYDASRTEREHLAIQKGGAPISLRPKHCACGKKVTAKLLAQHGTCDGCRLTADLEPGDLARLQHMLGVSAHSKRAGYRNHYCCGIQDRASMLRLVAAGLAIEGRSLLTSRYFHATVDGCRAAGLNAAGIRRAMEGQV